MLWGWTARSALAAALLVAGTSCVPQRAARMAAVRPPVTPVAAPDLLRQLGLQAPAGTPTAIGPVEATGPVLATAAPAFLDAARSDDDAARAEQCLTQAVYYEARSEPIDGQRAVAQVVLNRVRDRAFPASVCGVVFQHPASKPGCQFTFTCDGSMLRPTEPGPWARARAVAEAALAGYVYEPVGPATYYHANYVLPWWASSLTRIGEIGTHIFYRWRDGMEDALTFRQRYAGFEPTVSAGQPLVADALAATGGVAVHYGIEQQPAADAVAAVQPQPAAVPATILTNGVTVHRIAQGGDLPAPVQAGGVRVHVGTDPAGGAI